MENKIETWLPLFKGFYNTLWDGDSQMDSYCREYNVDSDNVDVDWNAFHKNTAFTLVGKMEDDLVEMGFIHSMTLQAVVSPTYYNFKNDSINVFISPNVDRIRNYIHNNMVEFDSYVRRKYTSYDGFISSHPNNAPEWIENTHNFNVLDNNKHTLGCLLDFILTNESVEDYDYIDRVEENVNFDEYCEITHISLQDVYHFEDRCKIVRDNIQNIDLEYGYLRILSNEAMAKSILLGTDFIEELVDIAYGELVDTFPFDKVNKDLEPVYK